MQERKVSIKKMLFKLLVVLIILAVIGLIGYLILKHYNLTNLKQEDIQQIVSSYGVYGPIIFIIISFLQVTFVPIPGMITILAGNYLFGFFPSFIYSFVGMFLGSLLAYFLGRKIGRPFVNWIVGDKDTVDYYLNKLKGREVVLLFFMFLLPLFPDDALCAIAGMLQVSFFTFVIMQVITRITSILSTLIFMSGKFIPYHGFGLVIIIILFILAIIGFIIAYKNSERINDFLIKVGDKINLKIRKKKTK